MAAGRGGKEQMVTGRKILTGDSGFFRGEVNRGPIFIVRSEMTRDGLLYVLTHRCSHGTLMEAG